MALSQDRAFSQAVAGPRHSGQEERIMFLRHLKLLLAALLLVVPCTFAQDDLEEAFADKRAELEQLHRDMGVAGSVDEYNRLKERYDRIAAEVRDLRRQIDAESNKDTACKSSINECTRAYKDREYVAARDAAIEAIGLCPDNPKAHYMLGLSQKRLGKFSEALAAFDAAAAADPGYHLAILEKGSTLATELQRPTEGLRVLDQLIADQPQLARAPFEKGLILMRQKDFSAAARAFDAAVSVDPDYTKAWIALAQAHVEAKDCNRALAAVEGALQDRGNRSISEAYFYQAVAYNQCGRFAEAETAVQACLDQINRLRTNKSFIQGGAWYERGVALDQRERHADAIRAFEEAASSREWSQSARYEIDRIRREQGL
jgi:tetratricopeptide (TPR) repeat protein